MADLSLKSPVFNSGDAINTKYTCDGTNISPPLRWSGSLEGAQSLVLILDDPDASQGTDGPFVHWLVYNIPADIYGFDEDFRPGERPDFPGLRGRNSFGNPGYEGPCPPFDEPHRYYFRLFALDQRLDITAGATRAQVMEVMRDHILDNAELMCTYRRTRNG